VKVFIDSSIPMYVAGGSHPHREPAKRFLARVQRGDVEGCTSTEVLQEILYRYAALQRRDLARDVYDLFVQICPVVFAVTLADTDRARDLLLDIEGISARDAVHVAVMLNQDIDSIASFDRGFERVPGIRLVELN
jgi:predicted nucleic acid-binding protein